MTNRTQEMDTFLKNLASIYIQNPNIDISNKTIYHFLTTYDIDNKDLSNQSTYHFFKQWVDRFQNKPNIRVYHDLRQSKFLQFKNRKANDNFKFYKIYVNLPKDKLYDGVNKIFDYIEKNNFSSHSKVADKVRSDAIVLRLETEDEARSLMNYINSEFKDCAHKPNPFLVRNGVTAIGYDDLLSYNSNLSDLIETYLKYHRQNNSLNTVNINNFKDYVTFIYRVTFKDINGIKNFDLSKQTYNSFNSDSEKILNYDQIMQIIIKSLNEETTYNEIIDSIKNFNNKTNNDNMLKYYDSILNTKQDNFTITDIVNNYILYASKKYGNTEVHKYLLSYIHNNNKAITRDNNFRNLFIKYISPKVLLNITGPNINDYVESIISKENIIYK